MTCKYQRSFQTWKKLNRATRKKPKCTRKYILKHVVVLKADIESINVLVTTN